MGFWDLKHPDEAPAFVEARVGRVWTYADLRADVVRIKAAFPHYERKSLGLLIAQNRYECLAAYLAALNADCALILLDTTLNSALLSAFLAEYRPDWVFTLNSDARLDGYRRSASGEPGLFETGEALNVEIHDDVALLLSTSGSTGSPKLVRLALRNVGSNADSIAQYLELTASERPITSLPMAYSYGLSVINSHLHVGAAIVLTEYPVLRREFWDAIDRYGCTSFAGVPYTFQMLLQLGLLNKRGSSLKTLTQAGGRLEERYVEQLYRLALVRGWRFVVMYGQTEAAPRISYVPFEQLGSKIGSIGIAVPNGSLATDEQSGELIYSGPNVMLGYAECREDLAKGDELHGMLRTGDLARQDADHYFYITGRQKRFLKLFGKRFNLDEVEKIMSQRADCVVACYGSDDLLKAAVEQPSSPEAIGTMLCEMFDLPRNVVKVIAVERLPRTGNGKLDYRRLADAERDYAPAATS